MFRTVPVNLCIGVILLWASCLAHYSLHQEVSTSLCCIWSVESALSPLAFFFSLSSCVSVPEALQPPALGSQSRSENSGIVPPAAAGRQGGTEEAQHPGTNCSMSGREQRTSTAGGALHTVSTWSRFFLFQFLLFGLLLNLWIWLHVIRMFACY